MLVYSTKKKRSEKQVNGTLKRKKKINKRAQVALLKHVTKRFMGSGTSHYASSTQLS